MTKPSSLSSACGSIRSRRHTGSALPGLNKSLLALTALAAPLATYAQQATQRAEEPEVIDVTGSADRYNVRESANSKFTRPLLDTPQTVQVISQAMLREQGSISLMDALRNTPGITMQLGENGNTSAGDTYQMRGFATASSTFVDGLRDLGAVSRDVFNLEQVEVAKGPSGADVGRGAASGFVNLISKQPLRDAATFVAAGYGTADNKRVTLDTGVNVGEAGAARFNVLLADSDVAERDVVANQNYSFAPSLAFGLDSATRFILLSQHVRQDNTPDGGISALGRAGYTVLPFYTTTTGNVTTTTDNAATRALAAAINAAPPVDRSVYYGFADDSEDVNADMVTFKFEHDLGANTVLRNITRTGKTDVERILNGANAPTVSANTTNPANAAYLNPADPSSWSFTPSRQRIDQVDEIVVNQTSFNTSFDSGSINHSLTGGLELMNERRKSLTFGTAAATIDGAVFPATANPAVTFYSPDPGVARGEPYPTGAFTDGETATAALYVFDSVELNPQWLLSGGIRYESYETTTDSASVVNNAVTPNSLEDEDELFSWKVGAVYKPASNGSVYVSFATSQTPPGSANFALSATATSQDNSALDPQETENAEVGTKWSLLNEQLSLSAAIFNTENGKQASFDDLGNPVQIGRTVVDGIELSAVGQITNFWQVSAGITKLDVEVENQQNATGVETTGVRWTPELSATLWTAYTHGDLTVGGGVRYFDEQKRNITASTAPTNGVSEIPSYSVVDMMVAYQLGERTNLRFNLNNVTDEEYVETLNNGGNRLRLGASRTLWLTGEYRF
jgi:catecholate siderophore receptor